jgi:methylmalonyl-CoA/ethylmalonyl-CoA epimerase
MFDLIDHVGVAVSDLDAAIADYERNFDMTVSHRETIAEQGVEAVLLDAGPNHIELLAPLHDDTAVGRFIARRGPGLHHVAYRVDDCAAALTKLAVAGVVLIDEQPRDGIRGSRVAFIHPRSAGGVLTEIVQPAQTEDH